METSWFISCVCVCLCVCVYMCMHAPTTHCSIHWQESRLHIVFSAVQTTDCTAHGVAQLVTHTVHQVLPLKAVSVYYVYLVTSFLSSESTRGTQLIYFLFTCSCQHPDRLQQPHACWGEKCHTHVKQPVRADITRRTDVGLGGKVSYAAQQLSSWCIPPVNQRWCSIVTVISRRSDMEEWRCLVLGTSDLGRSLL